ncbi:MAG: hypothetical protein JSV86_13205 [Gemmatimonadota bacterium]|nr:MAG: hypothetical protein JSV86_13205 [Gemmatimonadota bacterium]
MTRATWPALASLPKSTIVTSSLTSLATTLSPNGDGAPSSVADGVQLDNGMFRGYYVRNSNGLTMSINDDGAKYRVTASSGAGQNEWNSANAFRNSLHLEHPQSFMGDIDASMKFKLASPMGSATTHIAFGVGGGKTLNECRGVVARFGRWQTTNGREYAHWLSGTDNDQVLGTVNRPLTNTYWLRWTSVEQVGTLYWKQADGDPWSTIDSREQLVDGSARKLVIGFYPAAASETFDILAFEITKGYQYDANP